MRKKLYTGVALAMMLAGQQALAQDKQQQVRVAVEKNPAGGFTGSVFYRPSDGLGTTGLGIRVHYSTNEIVDIQSAAIQSIIGVGSTFISSAVQADTNNSDGKLSTDKFINAAWASFSGPNFPSASVPSEVLLFKFDFELAGGTTPRPVEFTLTSSSTPSGYTLVPTNFNDRLPMVNDAPSGTNNTVIVAEDGVYAFKESDFGFSDALDNPANNLKAVKITSLPTAGTLTLSGVAVIVGQSIAKDDLTKLAFAPAANASGDNYANFKFQVQDDGGIVDGGIDLDPSANDLTVTVTSVNDAPTGADTTVVLNEDTTHVFKVEDVGFSDKNDNPTNKLKSIIVTQTTSVGAVTLSGVPVIANQEIAAADITNLIYTPPANANGSPFTTFKFKVKDEGGTVSGGIDTASESNTLTFNMLSVNDAPTGANNSLSTFQSTPLTFKVENFGFADALDTPPNNFSTLIISSLPVKGSLQFKGSAVSVGDAIATKDIESLQYVGPVGETGANLASFQFRVKDDGGGSNGGVDTSVNANTIAISVTDTNDAPAGKDKLALLNENSSYTFEAEDFGFSDTNDTQPNNLKAVKISTLPSKGSLTVGGATVTVGQFIAAADLSKLVFTPVSHGNGNAYSSFTFQVQDDGGTLNNGIDIDPVANTFTFNVTAANSAPSGTNKTATVLEGGTLKISSADFGLTDSNDTPANTLAAVKVVSLPLAGKLEVAGKAVTVDQVIPVGDFSTLVFTPEAHKNGQAYASFGFIVQDDGGTANGGKDVAATANTFTVDVTAVNSAPAGTDKALSMLEGRSLTFMPADFGLVDAKDTPPDTLAAVVIESLPSKGTLALNGSPVTIDTVVSAADLSNLKYSPPANAKGADFASFDFRVQDSGGKANGGVDLAANTNKVTISVTDLNSAPSGADNTLAVNENSEYIFSANDFGFSDADDDPANKLKAVKVSSLPAKGTLTLNGNAVSVNQFVAAGDLTALKFIPAAHANGASYASFSFQVQDDGGTQEGGVDLDATANTISFNVTAANSAPSGADNKVVILEDASHTFSAAEFGFSDSNDVPVNTLAAVQIVSLPTNGVLKVNGNNVAEGAVIAVNDIAALKFEPEANKSGAAYSSFTFKVKDDGGTLNGGVDLDTKARTMTVEVTSVNDAPTGTNGTVGVNENKMYAFKGTDFGFADTLDSPPNVFQSVKITSVSGGGKLEVNGETVADGQVVPTASIGSLMYTPAAHVSGAALATFGFQVQDNGGTQNNGVNTDPVVRTMTINVQSANSAPSGTDKNVQIFEGATFKFAADDFGFSDLNDKTADTLLGVKITTLPSKGELQLDGSPVAAGQTITAANADKLSYKPAANGNGTAYSSFSFQVQDNGGTANDGVDLDPTANTFSFDVAAVNSAPSGLDSAIDLVIGNKHTFSAGSFGFSDSNDSPQNTLLDVTILTIPSTGKLLLGEQQLTAETVIPAADISKLVFDPVNPVISANFANITFKVRDNGGVANGGVDIDPTPNTVTFGIVSGENQPAVLSGTNAGNITEDSGSLNATGKIVVTDVDDNPVVIAQSDVSGTFGSFAISADGSWSYTANNQALQRLNTDVSATDVFTVTTLDGTTGAVTIALSGVNDAPVQQINQSNTDINDTDGKAGEVVDLSVTATDIDGSIVSTQWQVGGVTVATGATASISLPDGFTGVLARSTDNSGAFVDSVVVINVKAPASPVVAIEGGSRQIADTNNQAGEQVSVSATATDSDGSIVSTEWLVGGQVVASGLSATLSLPNGSSNVSFRAKDNSGLTSVATVTINVGAANVAPVVSIAGGDRNLNDTDGKAGESVSFSATATDSDGTLTTTEWLLNDVVVATGLSANIALPDGDSRVSFRATDNGGLKSEASVRTSVKAAVRPTVSIVGGDRSILDTDGLPGERVSVTASATDQDGTIVSTEWLIDGAVVATGTSAQLTLPDGGTVVSFRATDNTGASSTTSVTLAVASAVLPVVSIEGGSRTVADSDGQPGEAVNLSATATDANGTIGSSEWLINGDVVASGLNATLKLPDGVSAITFRAKDNDGFSSTAAINVTVVSPTPNVVPTVSITSAVSTVTDSDGKPGELVQLSSVARDIDGTIALTEWLVGGTVAASGTSASLALPDGESDVTVRVTDNLGATASASTKISVSAPRAPVVNIVGGPFNIADSNNLPGETVSLFANASDSDGTIVSTRWLSNGAAVAVGLVADVSLPDGNSELVFEATDSQGLTSSTSVSVTVQAPLPPPTQQDVQQATAQLTGATTQVQQALQQASGGTLSSDTVAQAQAMSQQAASSAESLARGVSAGTVDTGTALGALSGASSAASVSSQVGQATGNAQSQQQLANETNSIVRNSAAVLDALASSASSSGTGLTAAEQTLVKQSSSSLMQTAGGLSGSVQNAEELAALAQTTNQIIQANTRLGIAADENTVNQIREVSAQISTVAVKQALQASGSDLNLSDADIKQLLTQNNQLLETVFQATLTVPPAVLVSQQQASQAVNNAAAADGVNLDADAAERLAATTRENVVRPGDVVVNGVSVLDLILNLFRTPTTATLIDANGRIASVMALEANQANITVNQATGAVTVVLPGETYAGVIVAVRSVPATVPEGIRFRADGRGMIVSNGIAIELAPAPVDLLRFAAAVEGAGFKFNMRKNASIWLDLGNGERFSGATAYDNLTGINTANCGAISFIDPVGPVNSAAYAFGVKCANGVVQTVQPFVDNTAFFDSLSAAGFNARVDRNTGFVSVQGETFKPSFFVSPLTASERVYHAERKDSFGIAYQAIVNPDGRVDYKVISANGVQMLYGVR